MVDFLESNNSAVTATRLDLSFGFDFFYGLDIDSNDEDWFSFSLNTEQQSFDGASLFFSDFLGDLDLQLYSASDTTSPLLSSTGVDDIEFISFETLSPGDYFLRVYGFEGTSNPFYDLEVSTSVGDDTSFGDLFEPNNSAATATELDLSFGFDFLFDLDITSGDEDWFSFSLDTEQLSFDGASLFFSHSLGDLDLQLYSASDTTSPLLSSTGVDDSEFISFETLSPGDYLLRVYGFGGASNPFYDLEVFTSVDSNTSNDDNLEDNDDFDQASILTPTVYRNLAITDGDPDFYQFSLSSFGTDADFVSIDFIHDFGDLDIALYDGNESFIDSSTSVTDNETISLAGLSPGDYFLEVYGFAGATNPDYDLTIAINDDDDRFEDNDSFNDAALITLDGGSATETGLIITSGDDDWFRFTLPSGVIPGAAATIDFLDSQGDLDIDLYDSNNNFIDSSTGVIDQETIALGDLDAGDYYLRVYGYAGASNPNYDLTITAETGIIGDRFEENDTPGNPTRIIGFSDTPEFNETNFIRLSATGEANTSNLSIESGDDDWYSFSLAQAGQIGDEVSINFLHSLGDLDLELYNVTDTTFSIDGSFSVSDNESISLAGLAEGDYLVRVYGFAGDSNPNYSLTIDVPATESGAAEGDRYEPNNEFENAVNIQEQVGRTIENLSITEGDVDWYEFTLDNTGMPGDEIRLEFVNNININTPLVPLPLVYYDDFYYEDFYYDDFYYQDFYYLDLELYNAANQLVDFSYNFGTEDEYISLEGLDPGNYYIQVYDYDGAINDYNLTVDVGVEEVNEIDRDDRYEENNSFETAHIFGLLEGGGANNRFEDLVIQNDDWYKFEISDEGTSQHEVRIDFNHGDGDIDLILYDYDSERNELGNELDRSESISNSETVSLEGLSAGEYYIQVYGFDGATNPNYSLQFITPENNQLGEDDYEDNDNRGSATELREEFVVIPNLSIHQENDRDWFKFELNEVGTEADNVTISFDSDEADLDLRLYNNFSADPITSSTGTSDTETISFEGLIPGTYYAEVYSFEGTTDYSFQLSTAVSGGGSNLDQYEPNDSLETAEDLGTPRDGGRTLTNLSIHESGNADWFQFSTDAAGTVDISVNFDHDLGDIDLRVYDAEGNLEDTSDSISDTETITINNEAANSTYFVEVYGYSGATNPNYSLNIDTPISVNTNNTNSIAADIYDSGNNNNFDSATVIRSLEDVLENLNINNADDRDFFKFTTTAEGTSSDRIAIEFNNDLGNLDLFLYDSDEEIDNPIRTSASDNVNREAISLDGLPAGEYFVQVTGEVNPNYDLILDANNSVPESLDNWTIMVYMNGDNELESAALEDINEMEAVLNLPDNVNVVVQLDRSEGNDDSEGNWTDTRRGLIQSDDDTSSISSNLTSIGEQNMGDGATLTEFIQWGAANYTAQNYAVVIWDQGGGLDGLFTDQDSGNRSLNISEIGFAFDEANLGDELQFIGFDAGLMGLAEVGYEVSQYIDDTGVFVGSQQIEPRDGWDYTGWLNSLGTSGGNLDAEELGFAVVDSYFQDQTQSVVRASEYETLKAAINDFANAVINGNPTEADWDGIVQARNSAREHDWQFPNQRDLLGFMEGVIEFVDENETITNAANAVIEVIDDAVIDQTNVFGYGGIGIYLPSSNSPVNDDYNESEFSFLTDNAWDDFVEQMVNPDNRSEARLASRDYTEDSTREGSRISGEVGNENTPFDLGTLNVSTTYPDLSIHNSEDEDWFSLELPTEGTADYSVEIIFSQAEGDLNLELYDPNNVQTPLVQSNSDTDNESISFDGQSAGDYLLRVSGEVNPEYELRLNAPEIENVEGSEGNPDIPEDDFENFGGEGSNDTLRKATSFGVFSRDDRRIVSGLTMEDAPAQFNIEAPQSIVGGDWFVFSPIGNNNLNANTVDITFDNEEGNLDLYLFEDNGDNISRLGESANSDRNLESVSFDQTQGDIYIYVTGEDNPNYELNIARRTFDIDGDGKATTDDLRLAFLAQTFEDELEFLDEAIEQDDNLIKSGATRSSIEDISDYVATAKNNILDVDGNGEATTDDVRLAFLAKTFEDELEFLDQAIEQDDNLIKSGATRSSGEEIRTFVQTFEPKTLESSDEDDNITGTEESDTLIGGTGNDTLNGGAGNDSLYGGIDDDILTGGAGQDSFFIGLNSGNDTIQDFEPSEDLIILDPRLGFSNANDVLAALSDTDSGSSLALGNDNQLDISHQGELTANNFDFL